MSIPPVVVRPAQAASASPLRRFGSWIWSVMLMLLSMLMAMSAGGSTGGDTSTSPAWVQTYSFAGTFVILAVSVALLWRHRFPQLVACIVIGACLVVPTNSLAALIALAAVVAATTGLRRWLFIAAAWLATCAAMWWDLTNEQAILAPLAGGAPLGSAERTVLLWVVPLIAALLVAPFAAFGFVRQYRGKLARAEAGTAAATRNVEVMHREFERLHERQDLGRELHDTMAAKLSAVSLHAGSLELLTEGKDDRIAQAARTTRMASQEALDDLRGVVRGLKNPEAAGPSAGITDIVALIDKATAEGMDIRPQLFVTDPGGCDPQVAHTLYRLVQESLSNVRRHAPAAPVRVEVRGGPEAGITLYVVNWIRRGGAPTSRGGGNGLAGMNERVALVGGTFQAGATPEGTFAVRVWLPWGPR